ncbi:uncharacterized protein LOC143922196 isoform X1 [Arctopsyche grandis]|uniref:uncharacterized protein LOC143922196 isoform X1 n=2 Tax=Arctopsyche grandis TaxID=121162 RepID=UPI00406D7183
MFRPVFINLTMDHWTNDKIIRMLKLYKEAECLWDVKNDQHKCRNSVREAWKEISLAIGSNIPEVKRKVKNLCSQFYRERRKYQQIQAGGGGRFMSKWFAYDHMMFLKDKHRGESFEEIEQQSEEGTSDYSSDKIKVEITNIKSEHHESEEELANETFPQYDHQSEDSLTPSTPPLITSVPLVRQKKRTAAFRSPRAVKMKKTDEKLDQAYAIMKSIYNNGKRRDDCDVFGEYVASRLRNLRTDKAKLVVEHKISNILLEAGMGRYDYTGLPISSTPSNMNGSQQQQLMPEANNFDSGDDTTLQSYLNT